MQSAIAIPLINEYGMSGLDPPDSRCYASVCDVPIRIFSEPRVVCDVYFEY